MKIKINKIRRFFVGKKEVVAVYLYGSQAKKMATTKSDIDLAVLFRKPAENSRNLLELGTTLQKLLGNTIQVDLREIHLDVSPVFLGEVLRTGEVIFCRDEAARINFEVAVMRLIDDSESVRRINLYYLQKSLKEGTYGRPN